MGHSKKNVKQGGNPPSKVKEVKQGGNPDSVMQDSLSWQFHLCDTESAWAFSKNKIEQEFWDEIFIKLKDFEKMTYADIFVRGQKQNHAIKVEKLNPCAQKRLQALHIYEDEIYSLRLCGTHRLYGIVYDSIYCVLWFDKNHGDNSTCVCRSHLKHT